MQNQRSYSAPLDRKPTRTAFTLFEVLIASALSVILISAVYVAIELNWRYSAAGQDEVDCAILARTLLREIDMGVRGVIHRDHESEFPSDKDRHDTTIPASKSPSKRTPNEVEGTRQLSLLGGSSVLVVKARSHDPSSRNEVPSSTDDDRTQFQTRFVTYAMASGGAVKVPMMNKEWNSRRAGNDLTVELGQDFNGLVRLQLVWDPMTNTWTPAEETEGQGIELLASEVHDMAFRYFDGKQWFETWNGERALDLPRAINVTMQLVNSRRKSPRSEASVAAETYRYTIALPLAYGTAGRNESDSNHFLIRN